MSYNKDNWKDKLDEVRNFGREPAVVVEEVLDNDTVINNEIEEELKKDKANKRQAKAETKPTSPANSAIRETNFTEKATKPSKLPTRKVTKTPSRSTVPTPPKATVPKAP